MGDEASQVDICRWCIRLSLCHKSREPSGVFCHALIIVIFRVNFVGYVSVILYLTTDDCGLPWRVVYVYNVWEHLVLLVKVALRGCVLSAMPFHGGATLGRCSSCIFGQVAAVQITGLHLPSQR